MLDERFARHRYRSTSHAAVVGGVALGGWFLYQYFARDTLRLDILAILAAMAVTKLGSMVYYHFSD